MGTNFVTTQLAFDLFQEANENDKQVPITDIEKDIGLNRPNATINVKVGNLSLLGQKIVNALYFIAHKGTENIESYEAPLDYFKWLIGYNSKNNEYLKETIRQLRKASIDIEVEDHKKNTVHEGWANIPYIGMVYFMGGKISFDIPKLLLKKLQNPQKSYTYISLRITNVFTSEYTYNIYMRCVSYAFQKATPWWTVNEFRTITNTLEQTTYDQFKQLKAKIINPAIKQINELTDIKVELETRNEKGSKKIQYIRFTIEPNKYGKLLLSKSLSEETYKLLRENLGLTNSDITKIESKYDSEYIESKIEFTLQRMKEGNDNGKPIRYPGKYILKALEEDINLPKNIIFEGTTKQKLKTQEEQKEQPQLDWEQADKEKISESKNKINKISDYLKSRSKNELNILINEFRQSKMFIPFKKRITDDMPIDFDTDKTIASAFHGYIIMTYPEILSVKKVSSDGYGLNIK